MFSFLSQACKIIYAPVKFPLVALRWNCFWVSEDNRLESFITLSRNVIWKTKLLQNKSVLKFRRIYFSYYSYVHNQTIIFWVCKWSKKQKKPLMLPSVLYPELENVKEHNMNIKPAWTGWNFLLSNSNKRDTKYKISMSHHWQAKKLNIKNWKQL